MDECEPSRVVSYNVAVVQPDRGQPGIGLTLYLLLSSETNSETTVFVQLCKRHIWSLLDACAGVISARLDKYASFVAKTRASHQLSYGDKFLKTLPATDFYANFHRRRHSLVIPPAFLTTMQPAETGVPSKFAHVPGGMVVQFAFGAANPMVVFLADDIVFLMAETIDQAVWAAEWERQE